MTFYAQLRIRHFIFFMGSGPNTLVKKLKVVLIYILFTFLLAASGVKEGNFFSRGRPNPAI